ncbi:aryl-alcohol dehydrogenase [Lentzea atacamensis]|uniref:Aryl-alcohol dehydrogenase n=1 Tax=Lentzea atacamensis TaxID=531938 RepID=A0ABX9DY82_9PSEU|nr:NAD(P)-dependent alcohol dehydrogenase [Lentzea atacamensis]RAS60655.1 aryl-alcohol dehydrogenase [Lentzea atacamensis]
MRTTTAALSRGLAGPFSVEPIQVADPVGDEVLVRVVAVGVCHTDLTGRLASALGAPVLLGHEGAGVVEEVGPDVTGIRPGDHVVLSFRSCGRCGRCVAGRPAYCAEWQALNAFGRRGDGSPMVCAGGRPVMAGFFGQSSFAGYALAHQDNVVVVDPGVDLAVAAPFGCGFQTGAGAVLNVLRPDESSTVVVYGTGSVGLAGLLAAHGSGARTIAVNPSAPRRELALRLGATHALDPTGIDVAAAIADLTGGGSTHALDTTGVPAVIASAVKALAPTGTAVVVGLGLAELTVDVLDLLYGGKTLRGCVEGDAVPQTFIPHLLDLYAAGRLPVDQLITTFPLAQINEAVAAQQAGEVVKAVLMPEMPC